MSDHWESFPCDMGGRTAWISYDHGIRQEVERWPFPFAAKFKALIREPDDRGLPQEDEFALLRDVEDHLSAGMQALGGAQIGRITTNGSRYYFFYTSADEDQCDALASQVAEQTGYELLLAHEPDTDRRAYWSELFPTQDDWQVIQDLRVEQALRDSGDSLEEARPITHWAHFDSADDRRRFISIVGSRFSSVREPEAPGSSGPGFVVTLHHTGLPDYISMNSFTIFLARQARECGGEYSGWEAQLCKR